MYNILYLSHSSSFAGGSVLSLIYLLQMLDKTRYKPSVASISNIPEFFEVLETKGIKGFHWPGIGILPHTTGGWYPLYSPIGWLGLARSLRRLRKSIRATEELVHSVCPDIVHLNSAVLSPSAIGVKKAGVKLVWHIRESVVQGHLGLRKQWLSQKVTELADEAIFISEYDRQILAPKGKGVVIPNFVDFKRFDRDMNPVVIRSELSIPIDAKVILFFGGMSRLKGAHVLLSALDIAAKNCRNLWAIFAGAIRPKSQSFIARVGRVVLPVIGKPTERQDFYRKLGRNRLRDRIVLLPFRHDPERLLAGSDLVVFPSTEPHFARPVIEAGAMAKPVVASKIGGVEELVEDGRTGFLVPPNEPNALADAIVRLIGDKWLAANMGEAGYKRALANYNADINAAKIMSIYERLLGL
ncbi:MAG: glycosyltransferase family 4 protein [Deltaproteobacteria bacterium]|nr:glycosyltransferase family 4 protein [Deltaproteobacteria bacterium]